MASFDSALRHRLLDKSPTHKYSVQVDEKLRRSSAGGDSGEVHVGPVVRATASPFSSQVGALSPPTATHRRLEQGQ